MVNLTIDGKEIQVPEGTTIIRAAEEAGIYIPRLCDHEHLTPYGGCRLCLVEIEGARTLQPSCTLPASNNMVVHTNTPKIKEARKFVLNMIFSERNHFCPYCQVSGGDCELQNAAYAEGMTHWTIQPNWQPYEVDASHDYIVFEHNRCILCRRCVRACGELVGNFTLGIEERGAKSMVIADLNTPLGESSCISCGTCVQLCPTGALIDRWSAYQGKETEVDKIETICTACSVGCGITTMTRDNRLVRIEGDWDAKINNGVICVDGRFTPMEEERSRIVTPMVRKDGKLKAATWDEALKVVGDKFKPLKGKNGSGIAAISSTKLPIESLHAFKQIFADGFGSDMVTSMEEGAFTALQAKMADTLGKPFETKLESLKTADSVLTIGVDLAEEHQVAGFFIKRLVPKGTQLVSVDPQPNAFDNIAAVSLKAQKGENLDVVNGLAAAITKLGLAQANATSNPDKALKDAASKTNLNTDDFLKAAHLLASADNPVIVYGKDITSAGSEETLKALIDLSQMIGASDENKAGLISTKGNANSLAASQLQLDKPFKVNGQQAIYVALGDDEPTQNLVKRLEKAPFLVVQASFASQLSANADVVLPVENWLEQEGHFLNLDGNIQKAEKSLAAEESIWSNDKVLQSIAKQTDIKINQDWKSDLFKRTSIVTIEEL